MREREEWNANLNVRDETEFRREISTFMKTSGNPVCSYSAGQVQYPGCKPGIFFSINKCLFFLVSNNLSQSGGESRGLVVSGRL
jgi:hypothetical protein